MQSTPYRIQHVGRGNWQVTFNSIVIANAWSLPQARKMIELHKRCS